MNKGVVMTLDGFIFGLALGLGAALGVFIVWAVWEKIGQFFIDLKNRRKK